MLDVVMYRKCEARFIDFLQWNYKHFLHVFHSLYSKLLTAKIFSRTSKKVKVEYKKKIWSKAFALKKT